MKIVLCIPGNSFAREIVIDIIRFLDEARSSGWEIVLTMDYDPNIYYVRNKLLGARVERGPEQKPFGGTLDYDYVLWIDSDVRFNFKMIERLASHKKDAICGLYHMIDGKHFTVVREMDDDYFKEHKHYKFLTNEDRPTELFKIDYCGMGLFLVSKKVLESLEYPWFRPIWKNIGHMKDFTSEDVGFCMQIREAGYEIYCDPSVIGGHMKLIPI
jgi:hypothetical protein